MKKYFLGTMVLLAAVVALFFVAAKDAPASRGAATSVYDFTLKDVTGKDVNLGAVPRQCPATR